jgi:outer membrane lipoprotein-sorting protein
MQTRKLILLFASVLLLACHAAAQTSLEAALTAEQVLDKAVEAAGGRALIEKNTSMQMKGTVKVTAAGLDGTLQLYAKAPNKRKTVVGFEGYGEIIQAFDGQTGWSVDPQGGFRLMQGAALENARRESVFNAELRFSELYRRIEMLGQDKVGDRQVYVIKLTPPSGAPTMTYWDAASFLLLRLDTEIPADQGALAVQVYYSDYQEVDGMKAAFSIRQVRPDGDILIRVAEVKHNIPIEDVIFDRPAARP